MEIARALLQAPELLPRDEPTVGLDVPTREAIVDDVHHLSRDQGVAVLRAIHLIDEVSDGDSVVLRHGRVRADGPAADVARDHGAGDMSAAFATPITDQAT